MDPRRNPYAPGAVAPRCRKGGGQICLAGEPGQFAGPLLVGSLVGLHWAAAAIFAVIAIAPLLAALAFSRTTPSTHQAPLQ